MLREIGGTPVGPKAPAYVVAEIGLNHGGSVAAALEMVDQAALAGASAVKLQTVDAAGLVSATCPPPAHVQALSLQDFFARFELDAEAHRAVVARARQRGLGVLTTPLSVEAVDWLEPLGFDAYKIASGDLTYDALIARVARTGRPVILSTGMSSLWEISAALEVAREAGGPPLALLHCVSAYPTPDEAKNLRAIATLADTFGLPVGLSDHGVGTEAAVPALTLGACLYERHLVLDDDVHAVDRAVSSTPSELATTIAALERARTALGDGRKICQPAEAINLVASRRGVYARRFLAAGTEVALEDISVVRPQSTLTPRDVGLLVGRRLSRDLRKGEAFDINDLGLERAS